MEPEDRKSPEWVMDREYKTSGTSDTIVGGGKRGWVSGRVAKCSCEVTSSNPKMVQ